MPTGRIPLGNGSGRAAILPSKKVLAFLWSMVNQEPARAVDRQVRLEAPAMLFDFRARIEKLARVGMVEWNRIFRLFRFFGILQSTSRGTPKFRKMSVPFALLPGISGIFGRMESAPHFSSIRQLYMQHASILDSVTV